MTSTSNVYTSGEGQKRLNSVHETKASESSPGCLKSHRKPNEKLKQTIENLVKLDSNSRSLERKISSSAERMKKKEKIDEKIDRLKRNNDRRLFLQKARFAALQKEREEEMKVLEERLRKNSRSNSETRSNSFVKWHEKSREKLEKIRGDEEKQMLLKLELYNKKQVESSQQHQDELKKKSKKMYQINLKVDKIKTKMFNTVENDKNYFEIITKSNSISCKQQKIKNDIDKKIEKKRKFEIEKNLRMNMNITEMNNENEVKQEKIKEKHNKSFNLIQQKKNEWQVFLELKQEKDRMKYEKSNDFLTQRKKMDFKVKQDIISKHVDLNNKLKIRKNSQEVFCQRKRGASMRQAMEREKVRHIKYVVSKSREPVDVSRILSAYSIS